MLNIIKKYSLATFYFIVLITSGILLVVQSYIPNAEAYSLALPQLAPAFSAIIICLLIKDRNSLKQMGKAISLSKSVILWIPIIVGLTILSDVLTAGALSLLGNSYQKWNGTVVNIVFMACGCFFEELGWRGFLLPQLERKYNPFISTIIVGSLWGFWHMYFQFGIVGFLIFIITAIEMSIMMTWIYHKTDGNLILMALWHFSINLLHQVFLTDRLTAIGFAVFGVVLAVFCFVVLGTNYSLYFVKRIDQN